MADLTPRLNAHTNGSAEPSASASEHGFWWKIWQVGKVVQARLRFLVLLAAIGTVIGFWDTINGYYEKWTRPLYGQEEAVADDVEYFCPMHPFIVRDNRKDKCPICHMDLARRRKGAARAEPLAPGTVSRVQLSPYRVVLAGVRTSEVRYQPLVREITTFGSVEFNETTQAHIATRQKARIVKLYVNYTGQMVEKGEKLAVLDVRYSPELTVTLEDLHRARESGNPEVERMARQRLRLWDVGEEQVEQFLRTGKINTELTIYSPIQGHVIKKYQREGSFVDEGTPLYDVADLSSVWVLAQVYEADQALLREGLAVQATTLSRPGEVFTGTLDFIQPHLDEASRTLAVRFHIPNPGHKLRPGMYATVRIAVPPGQMEVLTPSLGAQWAREDLLRQGLVLAVPDSAVIDTGRLKVVYRQSAPDVFEGVAVELGPRLAGPGSARAFYPVLRGLQAGDRVVTNGSFLIDAETRLNPAAGSIYFGGSGSVKEAQGAVAVRPSTPEAEASRGQKETTPGGEDAEVRKNLAPLSAEDRKQAEAQRFCAVEGENRLGAMGVPVKVLVKGQPVFLCCSGCRKPALADPDRTLGRVRQLQARGESHER